MITARSSVVHMPPGIYPLADVMDHILCKKDSSDARDPRREKERRSYLKLKADPVRWEKYLVKNRERNRARYARKQAISSQL